MENCCGAKPTKDDRGRARQAGRQAVPEPELQPEPENSPDPFGHIDQAYSRTKPIRSGPKPPIISILIDRGIIDQNKLDKIRKKYEKMQDEAAVYPFSSNVPGHSRASSEREWGYMVEAYGNEINNIINKNATRYSEHFPHTNISSGILMFGDNFYKKLVEHWGIDLLEELVVKETGTAKLKYKKKTRKTRKKRKTRKTRKKRKKIKTKRNIKYS